MGDSADNAPMKWTLTGAAALLIAGCSPALNWRTVPLPEADLTITLPCKPDQATRTVELAANQPRTEEFRLAKNSGKLVVVTEPPDAKVYLNGEEHGVTQPSDNAQISRPLEIDLLPPGSYTLQLSRPGYRHRPSRIDIRSNAIVARHEKMERIFVVDTRVYLSNGIVRDGMLLKRHPNGKVDLELETGTVLSIDGPEILKVEPAPGTRSPP